MVVAPDELKVTVNVLLPCSTDVVALADPLEVTMFRLEGVGSVPIATPLTLSLIHI